MRSGAQRYQTSSKVIQLNISLSVNISIYTHVHVSMFVSIYIHVCITVCDGRLPVWNIALIVLGVICFIAGVVIAVILIVLLFLRVTHSDGMFV